MSLELETLLAEVNAMPNCTKENVIRLIKTMAGKRVYFAKYALVKPDHIAGARKMLDQKMARDEVRDRLKTWLSVSDATAYRIINKALNEAPAQQLRLI